MTTAAPSYYGQQLAEQRKLQVVSGDPRLDVADRVAPDTTSGLDFFPKQELAEQLSRRADILLFGGAAGPGKTEWGMEHCIRQMLMYPKNHGIIFRRIYPSLEESVIPRMKDKLAGRAVWNGGRRDFTFPNGSVLSLGHLQKKDDVRQYQGAEFGVVFFEEVTEFLESQFTYMIHRLRRPDLSAHMQPHVIATTNPGGVGHAWVKRWFVDPDETDLPLCATCFGLGQDPTECRDFAGHETGDPVKPEAYKPWRPRPTPRQPRPLVRCFVPGTMDDNPLLQEKDPGYEDRVRTISDQALMQAMLTGDWDVIDQVEGALWKQSWFDDYRKHKLPTTPISRVLAVDPSDGIEAKDADEFGVWVGCMGMDGITYTEYSDGWIDTPAAMAKRATKLARDLQCDLIVIEKNHGGAWLKTVFLQQDPHANIDMVHASHGKLTRAEPVAALFDPRAAFGVRAKMIGFHSDLEGQCTTYIAEPGDESPNHMDAMVWGISHLAFGSVRGPARANQPRGGRVPRGPRGSRYR